MSFSLFSDPRDAPIPRSVLRDDPRDTEGLPGRAQEYHPGYPCNLPFSPGVPPGTAHLSINNLGDPHVASHYGAEVCEYERQAIDWLMRLWGCDDPDADWGLIGASETDGNLWGLYLGREALPDGVLLYGADAHSSIPKAARIQQIPALEVGRTSDGAIDLASLGQTVADLKGKPVILALTSGTNVKGANDDLAGAIAVLDAAGYGLDRRFIHVDGALNGMVVPFLAAAPRAIRPGFDHAIDSLSTSGHKIIGTPMPCGVLVCRRSHADRIARAVDHLRSHDTALMGSRNGHAVLAMWARLFGRGYGAFADDAMRCTQRAQKLAHQIRGLGVEVLCNPHSMTVVFPQPGEGIIHTYQLACSKGFARAIVMPSVTEPLLDRFVTDYSAWARRPRPIYDGVLTQPH